MQVLPTIELRGGRLLRPFNVGGGGGSDPLTVAKSFEAAGAPSIYVVDLDAIRTGDARNSVLIGTLTAEVRVPVLVQGEPRDRESVEAMFAIGAACVVLDERAFEDPGLVEWLSLKHPGRIAVSLDLRVTAPLPTEMDPPAVRLARRFAACEIAALIGQNAPDLQSLEELLTSTPANVVAGNAPSLESLHELATLRASGNRKLVAATVGRPMFDGTFSLEDATRMSAAAPADPAVERARLTALERDYGSA